MSKLQTELFQSSLLQAIIKELPVHNGSVSTRGSISYSSQEPWLFVGTVRENILFGQPYMQEKYKEVIRVCALQKDFDMFRHGDRTLVGEKGISLSGGQRARINLARYVRPNRKPYTTHGKLLQIWYT
jgi:ATP-binding cassette subfamily C (CFTR/MRP) protein 4